MIQNKITAVLLGLALALPVVPMRAQASQEVDSWEVSVKEMDPHMRERISSTMRELNGTADDRGVLAEIGQAVGFGLVGGAVDVLVSETINLAKMRQRQKKEWMEMIERENNYTDSITSIKGLKDFYAKNSELGALDPSDINFNGIEIRGMRNGREVIYMSCSIDRSRLDNLFRHSKFNLVLDTLAFYPYSCHLPNVAANGIRVMKELKKGKATVAGDTILRPGGNGFSFDDRENLRVGIDFDLSSSWINEAVQVHRDVELGNFRLSVNIPDNVTRYTYSRNEVLADAERLPESERAAYLARNLVNVEGECFVVPRSFMPLDNGKRMWGTGEYNIKVKVKEQCSFDPDSEKARKWREDYSRMRKMQNRSSEVREYFETLWNQQGMNIVKNSYKTVLTTGLKHYKLMK
ncbi:MAG: hypothetical protein K2M06_03005 [Muribaculaceae bacterium]|nr:hypothetical protein [Muribaculaceae bacterium]